MKLIHLALGLSFAITPSYVLAAQAGVEGGMDAVDVVSTTATVEKVDLAHRKATLLLENGKSKTFKVDKIVLTPGNTSSIAVKLEVGAASETVNVQAKTELVETSSTVARELYDADFALIRPDQHVAWRSNRLPEDLNGLLDLVTGWRR